ncbi:MAG TPA: hypothetical protein VNR66_03285 [Solirubrobacteraceae bacterium]|nr:hypothetical protein [Solirubrobacteraceae bacterium]
MSARIPSLPSRMAGRLLTGPAGHFAAGVIDWLVLLVRYGAARLSGRDPW